MNLIRSTFAVLLMMLSMPVIIVAAAMLLLYIWPPVFWGVLLLAVMHAAWFVTNLKARTAHTHGGPITGSCRASREIQPRVVRAWGNEDLVGLC